MVNAKRPRITDVAKRAGVSEGTVSVVLNNRVGQQVRVSEDTQRKIWEAVRELGYVANPVAQTLAGGRTRIAAVFTFEAIFPIDSRNFYYPFLIGIEEADRQGYDLLLVTGSNGATGGKRHIYHQGVNRLRRADGAILLGHGDPEEVAQLVEEQYPFVFVGKRTTPAGNISYVAADYRAATVELVAYLIGHEHRRIAYIRSTRQTEASQDRERGVVEALHTHKLPPDAGWIAALEPHQVTSAVVGATCKQGYTAFVTEDDELGRQMLSAAAQIGLQCPADFSLGVLGNLLNPTAEVPNWATFNIPRREMGSEAFKLLISLLALPVEARSTPLRKTLPCTFQPGESVLHR